MAQPSYQLKSGDVILKISGGGAGGGDPAERDPEKVRMDVINGFISVDEAKQKYKVALSPQTLELDEQETALLRSREKQN